MGFELGQRLVDGQHHNGDQFPVLITELTGIAYLPKDKALQNLHKFRIGALVPRRGCAKQNAKFFRTAFDTIFHKKKPPDLVALCPW